ncbi:MAG: DUF3843 family protein [Muribaculaceae bacterium]|nr:DUF3843 family protein [Muribaculaceae bacterium]
MNKKRKNPFAGKTIHTRTNTKDPEHMSIAEVSEELRAMEKALGKEEFNRLLEEAIQNFEDSADHDDEYVDDDEYFDDDIFDFDMVTPSEWSRTHPANIVCGSDLYYAELANYLCDMILDFKIPMKEPEKFARELGRVLAAYLEDIVSETKVFSAMRRVCLQRYGYRLPFYDCNHADYMPDHINEEDIRFLIWMTACKIGKDNDVTYSPLATGWALLSARMFDELDSRYEEAPEARRVTDWLRRSFRKEDYIEIREIATWLVFRNPLSYFPGFLDTLMSEAEKAYMDESVGIKDLEQFIYGLMAAEAWQRSMSAMGCPSRTLTAAMAEEFGYSALAADIEAIEVLPVQIYAISQDKKSRKIFFETSRHERLEVERDSIAKGFRPDMIRYAKCNLIKYKGKYLLNGLLAGDPSLKAEWENQHSLLTFEQQREQAREWIGLLDGEQAICVAKMESLLKKLDLPTKIGGEYPDAKNFIVLISRELGTAILPDMGYAFDLPGNRFYRKRAAAKDSFNDLVFHNAMPHDVAVYIQEHNLLPEACIGASQGKETGRKIVQDYIAFWIGFYCRLPAYGDAPKF